MSEIDATAGIMEAVASMVDGKARVETRYPAWEPNLESQLLKRSTDLYRSLFDREPVVEIIHAGLECGVIASRYSGMDMISLGPTITGAHSPDERLNVPSVEQVWLFLSKLIASFAAS
jgi:dipeptidase D